MNSTTAMSSLRNFLMRSVLEVHSTHSTLGAAINTQKGAYVQSIAGYYREKAVTDGINKYFK
jgi:hypothetical protein